MPRVRLGAPIREYFDDTLPEEQVLQLWLGVQERGRGPRARTRRAWVVVLVCLFASLAAVAVALFRGPASPSALRLADGRDVPRSVVATRETALSFDDGSRLEVAPGAALQVLESTHRAFTIALRRGKVVFDVRPGGQRTWRVECGSVAIEVVGTRFTVERSDGAVRVSVERGAVLVRGDAVPDRVVRLDTGQSVTIPERGEPTARTESAVVGPSSVSSGAPSERASVATSEVARKKATRAPTLSPEGAANRESPVPADEALFAEADASRRAGRLGDAVALLERIVSEHPDSSRVPLAEFTLGRIRLDSLSAPNEAAAYFLRALQHGLPAALAEDARARVVEAYARAGKGQAARDAASTYRAMYPNGRRLPEVEQWSSNAP